ncbi:conserved domain protein [Peptoniphilus sp. oral taxon 375 str. F0436]|nr:conserved domain protein [Peptoniphilus sp. oral taxon 375 str. F0436]
MKFIVPTLKEIVDNPKSKISKGDHRLYIQINYNDALGKPLSDDELREELENARRYVGAYRIQRQGLLAAKLYIERYITLIETVEKSASRRYQLLKYVISRLTEEPDSILDEHGIKDFVYSFEKEKGKTVLKVDYDLNKAKARSILREQARIDKKMDELLDLINDEVEK